MKYNFLILIVLHICFGCHSQNVKNLKELNVSQEEMIKVAKSVEKLIIDKNETEISKMILDDHNLSKGGKKGYVQKLIQNYSLMCKDKKSIDYDNVVADKISFDGEVYYYRMRIRIKGKSNMSNFIVDFLETGKKRMIFWDATLAYVSEEDELNIPELPKF